MSDTTSADEHRPDGQSPDEHRPDEPSGTDDADGPSVRVIGPSLPYADDAEARLLALVTEADDVTAGSDELERKIDDWPSRYHLSAARGGLLIPFRLGPGTRVLEVGAGCGAITRHLGETGANVVAVEGSHARARVAAARCRDLPNVEVLAGPLSALEDHDGFDVAVVIGVLEYAGDTAGGGDGASAFLAGVRALLRDDGCLILAIENQFGLRYLLGYPEDHLGEPWVGVAGYPGTRGVRTYARRALTRELEASGFVRHRWFFPFPDYKLPRLVLSYAAYEQPDAVDFVDQLVRSPAPRDERDAAPTCEERAAHRTFLEAGLGREIANAFVVCASGHAGDPGRLAPTSTLAWILSQGRARPWRRLKIVQRLDADRAVHARPLQDTPDDERPSPAPWLRHQARSQQPYVAGTTVEQQVLDACRRGDATAVGRVLASWSAFLTRHESTSDPVTPVEAHPLLGTDTALRLPPSMVDVDLANFVADADGALHYIDDEWHAPGGVDARLARLRALWHVAVDLVTGRAHHPWPHETPAQIWKTLAATIEIPLDAGELDRLLRAESALVAVVTAGDAEPIQSNLDTLASWTGPRNPLEAQLAGVLTGQARATKAYEAEIAKRGDALAALHQEVETHSHARDQAQQERDHHRQRADDVHRQLRTIQQSRFWRLWQRLGSLRRRLRIGGWGG